MDIVPSLNRRVSRVLEMKNEGVKEPAGKTSGSCSMMSLSALSHNNASQERIRAINYGSRHGRPTFMLRPNRLYTRKPSYLAVLEDRH